ncbi:serine hydrolase [uncultured Lacinutrix sp.]|uniref:serine hydrolase domain-containing protein n=1 Tax=uncultured Lacinutrix sp. TaxID=574032 RepID=UPI0026390918|nr:serine hydrolase [uncultured Lacinutrix sp.]
MKSITVLILFVYSFISCQNNKNISLNKKQSDHIQLEQTNNIYFAKNKAKIKGSNTPEFSKHFNLNEDKHLSIHFTLDKPLVHSLQLLAPKLSEDELLNNGNFQFSFLVDNEIVYVENLNTGAGLKSAKKTQLEYSLPLISPERIDHWGWYLWLKFMKMSGGRDKLDKGKHVLSIEIRTYLNNEELHVGKLLAKGNLDINVKELPFDQNAVALQTIAVNSGWDISKDHFNHSKIEALNKKIAQKRFENINGIVVIKEGELLIEEYFNGETRGSLHDSRSVGKSIASTMMGIAIEENYIKNEEQQLKEFYKLESYKNYEPAKDLITLKSLLTMSSGFLGDDTDMSNPGNEEYMYPTGDWVKFALDQPIEKDKIMEKDYTYFTAGVVVLGDIIHKSVPNGLVSYADKKLFAPLNITNYKWQYTPQNVGNTAGGIRLRAIDFAKYGQLYKNNGKWNDKQIISKKWVEKSLAKQVSQAYTGIKNGYYGYLFWNKTYTIDGKDYEVSFCTGNGGNKIFIFKDIPFVIVITASAYNMPYAHSNVDKMMIDYILPAILDKK